jgi:hypothetical protein
MNQTPIKWQRFGKIARFGKVRVLVWKSNNPVGIMKFETRGLGPCAINQYLMNGKHFESLEELTSEITRISPPA